MLATMDLNLVTAFVRVVEAQSFTLAAKSLDLPKSSVSRRVTELEDELGVQLLHRTTRKLSLTEAGRSYFEQAVGALASLDAAADAAAGLDNEPRGIVRVTAPVDIGVMALPDVIADFARRYPEIHVELSLSSRVTNLVDEGFDLAVRAGTTRDVSLVSRRIGNADLGLFASPGYLAERGRPKSLADLAAHDCVLFQSKHGKAIWRLYGPNDEPSTIEVSGHVSSDEMLFVRRAVEQGLGIGMLGVVGMKACKKGGFTSVERVLPEYGTRGAEVSVLTPSGAKRPKRVTLLRDFLVENLSFGCTRHKA